MKMNQKTAWQELYRAAMLELDASILEKRIEAAITAILVRRQELENGDSGFVNERQSTADALQNLRTLAKVESRVPIKPAVSADSLGQGAV